MQNVMEWFGNIEENARHSFISFDTVVDFYPSTSQNLLDRGLSLAPSLADILDEDVSIIKRARKLLFFNHGKNSNSNLLDLTMVPSYNGAEICELVEFCKLHNSDTWLVT